MVFDVLFDVTPSPVGLVVVGQVPPGRREACRPKDAPAFERFELVSASRSRAVVVVVVVVLAAGLERYTENRKNPEKIQKRCVEQTFTITLIDHSRRERLVPVR